MKEFNLIKKLEKAGYVVKYDKFGYWDQIPYIERANKSRLFLINVYYQDGLQSIGYDSKLITYDLVIEALAKDTDFLLIIDMDWNPFICGTKKIIKSW